MLPSVHLYHIENMLHYVWFVLMYVLVCEDVNRYESDWYGNGWNMYVMEYDEIGNDHDLVYDMVYDYGYDDVINVGIVQNKLQDQRLVQQVVVLMLVDYWMVWMVLFH